MFVFSPPQNMRGVGEQKENEEGFRPPLRGGFRPTPTELVRLAFNLATNAKLTEKHSRLLYTRIRVAASPSLYRAARSTSQSIPCRFISFRYYAFCAIKLLSGKSY